MPAESRIQVHAHYVFAPDVLHMFPGISVDEYGNVGKLAAVCMHSVQAEEVIE